MGIVWAVCKGIENEGYRRIIDVTANARARKKRKRAWYWGMICRRVNLGFSRRETAISPVTALLYYITPRAIVALYQFFSFLFFLPFPRKERNFRMISRGTYSVSLLENARISAPLSFPHTCRKTRKLRHNIQRGNAPKPLINFSTAVLSISCWEADVWILFWFPSWARTYQPKTPQVLSW